MWLYEQATGRLRNAKGFVLAAGYSGFGLGTNAPAFEGEHDFGPIPRGLYTMELIVDKDGKACDHGNKKAPVIRLVPDPENEMFGRTDFLMHGNNATSTASLGCIIMPHFAREVAWDSGDHRLAVVRDDTEPESKEEA